MASSPSRCSKAIASNCLGDDEIVNEQGEIIVMEGDTEETGDSEDLECKVMGGFWHYAFHLFIGQNNAIGKVNRRDLCVGSH